MSHSGPKHTFDEALSNRDDKALFKIIGEPGFDEAWASKDGNEALHVAVNKVNIDLLKALLAMSSVRKELGYLGVGYGVMLHAIKIGDLNIVKVLWENPCIREQVISDKRGLILRSTAASNHLAILNFFFEQNEDAFNAMAPAQRNAALHIAALNGHLGVVRRLMGIRAVKLLEKRDGRAKKAAESNEHAEVIELLNQCFLVSKLEEKPHNSYITQFKVEGRAVSIEEGSSTSSEEQASTRQFLK